MLEKKEDELKDMGVCKILKESLSMIRRHPKSLGVIGLMFIIPLSIVRIFALHKTKIHIGEYSMVMSFIGILRSQYPDKSTKALTYLILSLFSTFFSLVSVTAVVYLMACKYTGEKMKWSKGTTAVSKGIWKVCVTFMWWLIASFFLQICILLIFPTVMATMMVMPMSLVERNRVTRWFHQGMLAVYFLYMEAVWDCSCMVSLVEETYGLRAIQKGCNLLRGTKSIAMKINFVFYILFRVVKSPSTDFVSRVDSNVEMAKGVSLVAVFLITKAVLKMLHLVSQVVFYTVSKDHHGETIEKSSLYHIVNGAQSEYSQVPTIETELASSTLI